MSIHVSRRYTSASTRLAGEGAGSNQQSYPGMPWWRAKRVSAWAHAAENQVYTRPPTVCERHAQRLVEQGFRPEPCSCGGLVYAEPDMLRNDVVVRVRRCTGCGLSTEVA